MAETALAQRRAPMAPRARKRREIPVAAGLLVAVLLPFAGAFGADFRNRLRTVRGADGHHVAMYAYDAVGSPHLQGSGRRVRRTVAGRDIGGDPEPDLYYMGPDPGEPRREYYW